MRDRPLAHLFCVATDRPLITRVPLAVDVSDGKPHALRGHLNLHNPQAQHLGQGQWLAAFSGPDSYISPTLRTDRERAATWAYTAVHVWGSAHVRDDRAFFKKLIDDMANLLEPRYREQHGGTQWSMADVSDAYFDRLFPLVVGFEIHIDHIEGIAKLHQEFPAKDAEMLCQHLANHTSQQSRDIAALVREQLQLRATGIVSEQQYSHSDMDSETD